MSPYDHDISEPTVIEVVAIEPLPLGANGSRRAVVRWSDGETGEALRWFGDEFLFSEGRLHRQERGPAAEPPLQADRDYLQSTDSRLPSG